MQSSESHGEATERSTSAPKVGRSPFRLLERAPFNVTAYKLTGFGATRIVQKSGQDLKPLLPRLREKGYVLDLTVLSLRDFVLAQLGAPTLDLGMKGGDVYRPRFSREDDLSDLGGIARKIAETSLRDPSYCGLDSVSLSGYVAYWRARGARVGRKIGERLIWFRRRA